MSICVVDMDLCGRHICVCLCVLCCTYEHICADVACETCETCRNGKYGKVGRQGQGGCELN